MHADDNRPRRSRCSTRPAAPVRPPTSPSNGAALDHDRHLSGRARPRAPAADGRALPVLPARRLAEGRAKGERACRPRRCRRPRHERHPPRVRLRARASTSRSSRSPTTPTSGGHEPRRRSTRRSGGTRSSSCSTTSPTRTRRRCVSPGRSRSRACRRTARWRSPAAPSTTTGAVNTERVEDAVARRRGVRADDPRQPAHGRDPERPQGTSG